MQHTRRRTLVVAMLGAVAMVSSGCDAAAAEGLGRLALEFYGGVLTVVVALIAFLGSIPVA